MASIQDVLDEIRLEREERQSQHQENKKSNDRIWKLLNGNGKMGFCAKVNVMWWGFVVISGATLTAIVTAVKTFINQ